MSNKDLVLEIPYGTRDFLPREAAEKRAIEGKIAETFKRWGYDEVATPTIEFLDTLTMGNGSNLESKMFKLFDKENRTMALRYEMTTPIARVVASRLVDDLLPYNCPISAVFSDTKNSDWPAVRISSGWCGADWQFQGNCRCRGYSFGCFHYAGGRAKGFSDLSGPGRVY